VHSGSCPPRWPFLLLRLSQLDKSPTVLRASLLRTIERAERFTSGYLWKFIRTGMGENEMPV
jgi:hypothetical protein